MSAFARWFREQHGDRESVPETDDTLRLLVSAGERARAELERRRDWDARHTSALYAWQIKDSNKR